MLVMATQVAHPSRVNSDAVAAGIRALAGALAIDELLQALPRQQVEPLPAGQDYPIRLVWPYRDRVLPFKDFGAAMFDRIPDAELIRTGARWTRADVRPSGQSDRVDARGDHRHRCRLRYSTPRMTPFA